MELTSERFKAFNRLRTRYKIEPQLPQVVPSFSSIIVPVTIADEVLKSINHERETQTVDAVAVYYYSAVPAGKLWTVRFVHVEKQGVTGTFTFTSIAVHNEVEVKAIETFTAGTLHETDFHGQVLKLPERWKLGVNVDAHSVDGTLLIDIYYEEEDAF